MATPATQIIFCDFHTKNIYFRTLSYRKRTNRYLQESALTIRQYGIQKYISSRCSMSEKLKLTIKIDDDDDESRNLTKINERRLQPLLFRVIVT